MSEIRYILCESGDADLQVMVRMLSRAIAEHLQDWAVLVDPTTATGAATLYRPGEQPVVVQPNAMTVVLADIKTTVDVALANASTQPRAVHYLVLRTITVSDGFLTAYVGNNPTFFHVYTPIVPFGIGPHIPPQSANQWLIPNVGRYMPAIRLPQEPKDNAGPISLYEIGTAWNTPNPPERDSCRVRVNPTNLGSAEQALQLAVIQAVNQKAAWAAINEDIRKTFERWARTITWRRVGIVISGGGASVFRLVEFFHQLELKQVPIDLISGVSGGTVFAAAYAVGGMDKVNELVAKGIGMTAAVAASLASSCFIQQYFDKIFNNCGVRNTEIRVLALSTGFPPLKPPHATAIVDGTFGEAIRASGGAPFFGPFFPNMGDTRQVDGGITATVPPPFLAERFGADIVFAANVIAVPSTRFPGEERPLLGPLLAPFYRYTLLGRAADMWNAVTTMLHTIAEGTGMDADDFLDTQPRNGALIEPFTFFNLPAIVSDGLDDENINQRAQDWLDLWKALP